MDELARLRSEKDAFFANHKHSPLTRAQRRAFQGLAYFPENPDLRLILPLEHFENPQTIEIQTSTGDVQEYMRYGKVHFTVEGETAKLAIYATPHGFFLPFADSLAGVETYPAGRYLEPEMLPNGQFLVDFNLAYNPYCAYSDLWSCPLTPPENRLKVPIRAGEKIFKIG